MGIIIRLLKFLGVLLIVLGLFIGLTFWWHTNYEEKMIDNTWLQELPNCPCELPELAVLNDGWAKDVGNIAHYHPGSEVCIRSYPATKTSHGYSGQQCCYKNGKLIVSGAGAGTPDRSSTCVGENELGDMSITYWGAYLHYFKDVRPFNKMGWESYNKLWIPSTEACD